MIRYSALPYTAVRSFFRGMKIHALNDSEYTSLSPLFKLDGDMLGLEKRDKTFYKGVKDDDVVDSRKESNMSGKSHLNTDHETPT